MFVWPLSQKPLLPFDCTGVGYLDCSLWQGSHPLGILVFEIFYNFAKTSSVRAKDISQSQTSRFHKQWLSCGLSILPWDGNQPEKCTQVVCHQCALWLACCSHDGPCRLGMILFSLGWWGINASLPFLVLVTVLFANDSWRLDSAEPPTMPKSLARCSFFWNHWVLVFCASGHLIHVPSFWRAGFSYFHHRSFHCLYHKFSSSCTSSGQLMSFLGDHLVVSWWED